MDSPSAPPIQASASSSRYVDLREDGRLLPILLDDTHVWRERLVEEVVIDDSDHVAFTSAFQLRIRPELLHEIDPALVSGDSVRVFLPLTTRPKELLLNVDLTTGDGSPISLLLKSQAASLQVEYQRWFLGIDFDEDVKNLLYGISNYNVDLWQFFSQTQSSELEALSKYLDAGLPFQVSKSQVKKWQEIVAPAEMALERAIEEPAVESSSTAHVLRALPAVLSLAGSEFPGTPPISGAHDVERVLEKFVSLVASADDEQKALIAEYGRRWEVVVDMDLTLGEPTKVKLSTRRPWGAGDDERPELRQRFSAGDAQAVHLEARIADHGVVFDGEPSLVDLHGSKVGIPVVSSMRRTADTVSLYASNMKEPYYLDLVMRLKLRRSLRRALTALKGSVALAIVATFLIPGNSGLADNLAVLTLPLTLVGAILLTRESTAVAQRLQEKDRKVLVVEVSLLWLASMVRLLMNELGPKWPWESWAELWHVVDFW